MTRMRIVYFVLAIILSHAPFASAQEQGQIGISMGYPGSIGVVWHATDRLAVRPDFLFRWLSSGLSGSDDSSTTIGVGIAGIYYLTRSDALRTYVSPRFAYTHAKASYNPVYIQIAPSASALLPPTFESKSSTKSFSGSFGAQYALHKRFSVFGEAGIGYSTADYSSGLELARITIDARGPRSVGTQTAAGVILYFKD
jgi:hypothetical protein